MLSFDPSKDDFTKNYKFLIGGILPRPIAVVSQEIAMVQTT